MQAHFGLLNDHPIDRERGTLARVGYLTNQPRTMGVSLRFSY